MSEFPIPKERPEPSPIGIEVKRIRLEWKLSQNQFADLIGVTGKYISGIELGYKKPSRATERLIQRVIAAGPNQKPPQKEELKKFNRFSGYMMSTQEFMAQELPAQPNSTQTFVLTVNGISEWYDPRFREAILAVLEEKPRTQYYYCSPDAAYWDSADFATFRLNREKTEIQIHEWIASLTEQQRARVKHLILPTAHYFQLTTKTILRRFPKASPLARREWGALEMPTPQGAALFPLEDEAVSTAFNWLRSVTRKLDVNIDASNE